ncbi:MAG: hypothetical protein M1819_003169 [Sarea resinae]|nr:MAG: hypothetical protein M1819_003169 [Sarea resinae]
MLPPQLSPAQRALQLSAYSALRHAPALSTIVLTHHGLSRHSRVSEASSSQQRRAFWWGRYRSWASCLDGNIQRKLEKRNQILKHKYAEALRRNSHWNSDHNVDRSQSSWAWRSSSANVEQNPRHVGRRGCTWTSYQPRQETRGEQMRRRMEEVKSQVDDDPFRAIFGRNAGGSYYSPPMSSWSVFNWGLGSTKAEDDASRIATEIRSKTPSEDTRRVKKEAAIAPENPVREELDKFQSPPVETYDFDPITMRKVPRGANNQAASTQPQSVQSTTADEARAPNRLIHNAKDSKEEDLDLLRASDVRASAGIVKRPRLESQMEKQQRRGMLDADFDALSDTLGTATVAQNNPQPPVIGGEGDLSTNVAKFAKSNRWYKKKAPHALAKEAGIDLDRQLVREIKNIYENAHDAISTSHRRGPLRKTVERIGPSPSVEKGLAGYDEARGPGLYQFTAGQDSLEADLKAQAQAQKASDGVSRSLEEHDRTLGSGAYQFTTGQDALEAELLEQSKLAKHDGKLGTAYHFVPGQDSLESDLSEQSQAPNQPSNLHRKLAEHDEKLGLGSRYQYTTGQDSLEADLSNPQEQPCEVRQALAEHDQKRSSGSRNESKKGLEASQTPHPSLEVNQELAKHEESLGSDAYRFTTGQDSLESDLSKPQQPTCGVRQALAEHEEKLDSGTFVSPRSRLSARSLAQDPSVDVREELAKHDRKLGPEAYQFVTGQDSLETDLTKAKPQTQQKRYPEEPALRMEQAEQILQEEVQESDDLLYDIQKLMEDVKAESVTPSKSPEVTAQTWKLQVLGKMLQNSELRIELARLQLENASRVFNSVSPSTAIRADSPIAQNESDVTVYKVLAYDPSTRELTTATTTSSVTHEETPISPSIALSRLIASAKFVPHLPELQKAGFEIVAGGNDVLVFRMTRKVSAEEAAKMAVDQSSRPLAAEEHQTRPVNPVDGTTTTMPQTGNFASPTGFVNHDAVFTDEPGQSTASSPRNPEATPHSDARVNTASAATSPNGKEQIIQKTEPHFSGAQSDHWDKSSSASLLHEKIQGNGGRSGGKGKARTAKRVLLFGTWMAGCCYAVGVVAEYFRTGGSTGLGPRGF